VCQILITKLSISPLSRPLALREFHPYKWFILSSLFVIKPFIQLLQIPTLLLTQILYLELLLVQPPNVDIRHTLIGITILLKHFRHPLPVVPLDLRQVIVHGVDDIRVEFIFVVDVIERA